ncbi:MAG: GNAT family N-acetyltransferase, partial [Anaerolineales bacterium]|nr:GNAT family N-acetyltransferase [Anaerolineales bacterium]
MTITIRAAETMADCNQISQLEAEIWGGETTTASLLRSIMHGRGTMLMALDGEKVVGFCYSFLSFTEQGEQKELKHYSYILGVHPDYRNKNLGYQLKMAQREVVLEQGISHMTWTYDPLETRNANLNLSKLRGVCHTYHESFYGLTDDPLNKGMATDRFMVDWWVDSEWVSQPAELPQTRVEWLAQEAVIINPTIKEEGQ